MTAYFEGAHQVHEIPLLGFTDAIRGDYLDIVPVPGRVQMHGLMVGGKPLTLLDHEDCR